jgi:apolipoprotein N-acyltransferase
MSIKRIIYLSLAILGLVVPWYYNLQFFGNAGLIDFVNESSANLAAKSISVDLFIATVAGSTWMYAESKRVGVRFVWLYILLGILVAFAFAFPLFLFMRETELEKSTEVQD